ncbi:MAG: hypothetical protein M1815_005151 [Lichina confinis]|nr:MAG: hypothetical protein M1815_005151 [Lichina confinis]
MSPAVENFPVSQLTERVQLTTKRRRRKVPIKLEECELLAMLQYDCRVEDGSPFRENARSGGGRVLCEPVERLFRRCADNLMVETTEWEYRSKQAAT